MKIALAQMKVIPGKPRRNLDTMLRMINQAKEKNADLIAFPEMCLSGYLIGDKWLDESHNINLMSFNKELLNASNGIAIAYGNIFVDAEINSRLNDNKPHPNKDGRLRKYNSVYIIQNGKPVARKKETKLLPRGVQPKTLLPNYRFFDDQRYFFSMQDIERDFNIPLEEILQPYMVEIDNKKIPIGFELCEDLWCEDYRRNLEALNTTKILINNGAELIINISASPWTLGKNNARDKRLQFLKSESKNSFVPFVYVNCVGTQNNGKNLITFDGGSTVYNRNGMPIVISDTPYLEDLILVDDADFEKNPIKKIEKQMIAQKFDAILEGIISLKYTIGTEEDPKFVIGLSGGIDSAVVAAMLSIAFGNDKVLALNMPYIHNSEKTKKAAAYVASKLRIPYVQIPIKELVEINERILEDLDLDEQKTRLSSLDKENIPAKIRGTSILSNVAAKYNALFTNNGNKLEIALGYSTLYGDVNGAIAPIGDLTKTEIVKLAHYLNEEIFYDNVIPEILIPDDLFRFRPDQIEPSAELKEKQVDPMKFGYHCALIEAMTDYKKKTTEDIMKWYIEGTLEKNLGISTELIERWNLQNPEEFIKDLEWFDSSMQRNIFKRIQTCPIIITSKSAYGYDIRESLLPYETTIEHERLKKYILENLEFYKTAKEVKNAR